MLKDNIIPLFSVTLRYFYIEYSEIHSVKFSKQDVWDFISYIQYTLGSLKVF